MKSNKTRTSQRKQKKRGGRGRASVNKALFAMKRAGEEVRKDEFTRAERIAEIVFGGHPRRAGALEREREGELFPGRDTITLNACAKYLHMDARTLKADKRFPLRQIDKSYIVPLIALAKYLA